MRYGLLDARLAQTGKLGVKISFEHRGFLERAGGESGAGIPSILSRAELLVPDGRPRPRSRALGSEVRAPLGKVRGELAATEGETGRTSKEAFADASIKGFGAGVRGEGSATGEGDGDREPR